MIALAAGWENPISVARDTPSNPEPSARANAMPQARMHEGSMARM
jgi:hypothetical protein